MSDINLSKIRRLDGSLMLVFRELIRHRRTTVVGERLGLTQSAVSHSLARLRELFDDPLFVRRPKGLEPTQRALEIAPRIDELIRLADDALETGRTFDPATTRRNFRIGSGDFLSTLVAASLLRAFEREAPHASFAFKFLLGQQAIDALHRDEVDVVVGRFRRLDDETVVDHLYDDRYCVVAREGHPRVHGSIDVPTFASLSHVIISLTGELEQFGDRMLKELDIERHIAAAVPRFLTAFTLVSETDAILTPQRRVAVRYRKAFRLQVIEPPYPTESFEISAVRRRQDEHDAAIGWLIRKIKESTVVE